MSILNRFLTRMGRMGRAVGLLPGESVPGGSERGIRSTYENSIHYQYRRMTVDMALRQAVLDIRKMDRLDGRVKKLHGRMARASTNGGLRLGWGGPENTRIQREWEAFVKRLHLAAPQKLESDARGLLIEGNLPLQWVLGPEGRVDAAIRMPADTITPLTHDNGQFIDPARAYRQFDIGSGKAVADFALWQLSLGRLTPDNWDDQGSLGRPYLDSNRTVWQKLMMTEEDLVIRRRQRAPLRRSHILEGASETDLEKYRNEVEARDQQAILTDYYSNRKGSVTTLAGDANLDQIADVNYLLDTFFSGAPAPKGLFGYVGDLQRDILEDLKIDFFDELDALQDTLAAVYQQGFRLDLLLAGLNPDAYQFRVEFAERRTETPNQAADRALKQQAMNASQRTVWETAGLDPELEKSRREKEMKDLNPYPDPNNIRARPPGSRANVTVIPGNATKGESQTTVSNG